MLINIFRHAFMLQSSKLAASKLLTNPAISVIRRELLSSNSPASTTSSEDKHVYEDKKLADYQQGQENENLREYFYYFDHQGQLFLDDTKIKNFTSCYKEQRFLEFFFKNLRANQTQRYEENFPYVSPCQGERNYMRCEDLPFVVTHLDEHNDLIQLNQIKTAHWSFHFEPELLHFNPNNGRLYYLLENKEIVRPLTANAPASWSSERRFKHLTNMPCHIALIKSDINIHLMKKTRHSVEKSADGKDEDAYVFDYKGKSYKLGTLSDANPYKHIKKHSQHGDELP